MAINFVFALSLPLILRRFNLAHLLITSTIGFSITLVLFGSVSRAIWALFFYVIARLLLSIFSSAYSILLHDDSQSNRDFQQNQSLSGSLVNFSWMSMPFIAALIIGEYSFQALYYVAAIIALLSYCLLLIKSVPSRHKPVQKVTSLKHNFTAYFKRKRLRDAYIVSAGVDIYWVFIFTFVTLFLKDAGYSTATIGVFLTLNQLPLFLFEYNTYKIVKKYRYRAPFVNSFSFMSFVMLAAAILGLNIVTLGIFVFTSLFLVFLEPAREMYLYENLESSDEESMQPVYATAELTGSVRTRIIVGLLLTVFSQTAGFIFMALILGAIAFHNRTVED